MDANPFVLDISSDEEPVRAVPALFFDEDPPLLFDEDPPQASEEDFEWLRELLGVDKEKEGQEQNQPRRNEEEEDSDEVVILGECYNPPKPKRKRPGSKSSVLLTDDDDCVVLDGDPDDPVEVNDGGLAGGDGDELLVVGQKGQIACRDYAHSRHLCFKFPFNSSPHDGHCKLCHCYVCDIPAPCAYWGTGVSNDDHCHATDKEKRWKSQRENFRLGKGAPLAAANTMIPVSVTQIAPVRLPTSLVPQNMVSRPITVHPCSSSVPFGVLNTISQCRDQQSVQRRNGLVPHAVLPQALGIRHNLINQRRGHAVGNMHGQFISSSNAMFKRSGTVSRALATSQSVHSQSYRRSLAPVSQHARYGAPLASSVDKNTGGKQDALSNIVSESFRSPTNSVMGANAFGSEFSGHGVSRPNQSVNPVGNQSPNDKALVLPGINFNWLFSESNEEMSEGNIQLQNTWTNNEPSYDKQSSLQFSGGSQYENWLSGQSVPMPSEDLTPCLNVFPSEPPAYDASMLCFDFETSWKSVTHA